MLIVFKITCNLDKNNTLLSCRSYYAKLMLILTGKSNSERSSVTLD